MVGFGQLVIGPPGSGKTTYCNGLQHYFQLTSRPCAVVNLDPANHDPPYECAVSLEELISLEDVQRELKLGPNGGMVYCMEYLVENLDWLKERVEPLVEAGKFLLFDLPGQVELFNTHPALKRVIDEITRWDLRVCTVHLVDSHLCAARDPASCSEQGGPRGTAYGDLDFNLEYHADVQDLVTRRPRRGGGRRRGVTSAATPGTALLRKKYGKLTRNLCELVEDFGLVNFTPLRQDKESVRRVVALTDKCVGYHVRRRGIQPSHHGRRRGGRGGVRDPGHVRRTLARQSRAHVDAPRAQLRRPGAFLQRRRRVGRATTSEVLFS